MSSILVTTFLVDAVCVSLATASIMLVWFHGEIFVHCRSFFQAAKSLPEGGGVPWWRSKIFWLRWLGSLLSCPMCLSWWLVGGLVCFGLFTTYLVEGTPWYLLLPWLVLGPMTALIGQIIFRAVERLLGFQAV